MQSVVILVQFSFKFTFSSTNINMKIKLYASKAKRAMRAATYTLSLEQWRNGRLSLFLPAIPDLLPSQTLFQFPFMTTKNNDIPVKYDYILS